ncbi:MAG: murein biosynthesis integral membrane protein MurJ [Planctomycetes bacterium]|nr:murein biosynthesis integral membrane protein MurJ [Planctomycetota bacterium]
MPHTAEPPEPEPASNDIVGRHRKLVARTLLISGLTLCSRILGYARESLTAYLFGDRSAIYDAFVTAWRVPNLFRRLMGEGALSTSLQNAVTAADHDRGNAAGRRVFLDTLWLATWILLGISAVVMASVYVLGDTFPLTTWRWLGADPEPVRELTLRLTPFLIFACLAGLCAGALGVRGHFASPTWGPAVMNVIVIATLVAIWRFFGSHAQAIADPLLEREREYDMARWLAWGTLISGVALLTIQFRALKSHELWPTRETPKRDLSAAWGILRSSAPLALGAAVYQVNVMIDGLMAQSMLDVGGPSALWYANRIQQFPLALVATAATAAVYPALNALGHKRELGPLRTMHDRTQLAIVFFALPASIGLWVLARPVVSVLLEHGEFGAEGAARTAACMRWLCVSLIPAGAVGLVGRTYYALGDMRTPVRISIAMLIANVGLNWTFVRVLGMDCDGLTAATALTNWANLFLLLPPLLRRLPRQPDGPAVGASLGRMFAAGAACGLAAWGTQRLLASDARSVLALGVSIAAGGAAYALVCELLRVGEWQHLLARLRIRAPR